MSLKQHSGGNRWRPARLGVLAALLALSIMALTFGSTQAYPCWDGNEAPPDKCPDPPTWDIAVTVNADNTRTHYWAIDAKDTSIGAYISPVTHTYQIRVGHIDQVERLMVSGTIDITNTWQTDAVIVSVREMVTEDPSNLGSPRFDEGIVDCPVSFPYTLPDGEVLSCTFTVPDPTLQLHYSRVVVSTKEFFSSHTVDTPILIGPLVEVNDEVTVKLVGQEINEEWVVSGSSTLTYQTDFFCDDDEGVNTATASILETAQSDDAIVNIECIDDANGLLTLVNDTYPAGATGFEFSFDPLFLEMWTFASGVADPLNPSRLDVDSAGNLYVASYDNRVVKYDNDGAYLGQWGSPGSGPSQFNGPLDVAIDSDDNVYVLDNLNNRVQKFDVDGLLLDSFGDSGKGQLSGPTGMAVDGAGSIYVADTNNDRISIFDSQGDFVEMWGKDVLAGNAETGFEICTSAPADICQGNEEGSDDGEFWAPFDVAVDSAGNVYVADTGNARIQKFSGDGEFLTAWGQQGVDDGEFQTVAGLGIDARDYVYTTDWALHRVQKFTGDGTHLATWAGTDAGTDPGEFTQPIGIAFDDNNNAFVSEESGARVQKFVSAGARLNDEDNVTFELFPGIYTITEILPDGWFWDDVDCDEPILENLPSIAVEVDNGDDIVCTVYNTIIEDVADLDGVDDAIEDGAPNGGDGNNDGIPDSEQSNVTSLPNAEDGQYVTVAAPTSGQLETVSTDSTTDVTSDPLPEGVSMPTGTTKTTFRFSSRPNQMRQPLVGPGIMALEEPEAVFISLYYEGNPAFDSYYKYGPTPDNPTPHWYEFLYDGETGAEIFSDRIILHFIDGGRGDSDLTVNGVIDDPGGPVVFTDAELTVTKEVIGLAPDDWSFDVAAPGLSPNSLTLTDDDPEHTYIDVVPGQYTLTETDLPGWVTTASCSPNGETGSNAVTVDLAAGDFATCRFTNEVCRPGTYDDGTACVDTDAGHFTENAASVAPEQCATGFFQPYEGQPGCFEAEEGYYAPGPGATAQSACPTGTTSPAGSDSIDDCVPISSGSTAIFMSATAAGKTSDNVSFGSEDILMWDGTAWSLWFDGSLDANLNPKKTFHNIDAFSIPDPSGEEVFLSFTRNQRPVPGINGMVDGMDIIRWDGSAFSLLFDGQDAGLENLTAENIDALHVLPGSEWPGSPASCLHYLLISTKGAGNVPLGNGSLKFSGEDVLGFCLTQAGAQTTGLWTMVLDGSTVGMNKGSTESISLSADGQTLHLTTAAKFTVNGVLLGYQSMIYAYDLNTQTFSGPIFNAPANGLPKVVDGLQMN